MPRNEAVPLEGEALPPAIPPAPIPPAASRYASDSEPSPTTGPADELPSPAWYQDPENPTGMRYWDGSRWTEHRTDYLAAPAPKPVSEGLVAAGYILSFLIPIAGIVIGAMLIQRKNTHGKWILGLSLLFIAAFILVGELADPNSN
jgi:hypothetical protein